jgi:ferredoxin
MSLAVLKKVRVAVSLMFFLLTALVLLDFRNIVPPALTRTVLYLQFTPSLLNFLTFLSLATTGFFIVFVLTILFGRVYCSTICPLGTLQDISSYLSRLLRPKRYHEPIEPHSSIHFAFLLVTILPALIGTMLAVTILDPFSNFGRIIGSLVRPLIIVVNNTLSQLFEVFKNYDVYPVEVKSVTLAAIVLPTLFLVLVGWMSFQHGRLYCNSMCPLGSLLRIISKSSLFQVVIDADHCKGCQLCQRVCKAGCIDRRKKSVDFSRCVDCFNCFTVCPSGGLKFVAAFRHANPSETTVDVQRRSFLLGSSFLLTGSGIVSDTTKVVIPKKESTIAERRNHPVSPPGSLSIRYFTEACTGCHVCVSTCPSQVLQPSFLEYGLGGILQPRMDFNVSYCNFECTVCTEVCPTGAIRKLTVEQKKTNQAGRAVFVKENCVVYTENTDCGACTEHCPTKAVTMIPYKNSRMPEVKPEYCIGCGACEHACPTKPYKAIYVDGNTIHLVAKKKEPEKKPEVNLKDDFPF